jgi:hypothetical protein
MIVIIDTNAYHGDVEATGQDLTALIDAVERGNTDPPDAEIWTPRAVVEELVRQWPRRAERMNRVLGAIKHDLASFGLPRPQVPDFNAEAVHDYRRRREARLIGTNRTIADHPASIGKAVDWAAQHRFPVKPKELPKPPKGQKDLTHFAKPEPTPVSGVVDAAIWLTVAEAAATGRQVGLITQNTDDFADPSNKAALHPELVAEIQAAGGDPAKVKLYPTVRAFNDRHVQQSAEEAAMQFLEDHEQTIKNEIADAVVWQPIEITADWGLGVDVDESVLASFDPRRVDLVRADEAGEAFFMTLAAEGDARLDLGLWKYDVPGIPADSPVSVYDFDHNESMAAAEAEVLATITVELLVEKGKFTVSVEDVSPA